MTDPSLFSKHERARLDAPDGLHHHARPMESDELRAAAGCIRWYHSMDLGHGIVTRGSADPRPLLKRLQLPARLDGLSVLDIGAWDGFYSFEAERRGAKRFLATDHFCWSG